MREDDGARYATHDLLLLNVNATLVGRFKTEGELCEITTAQLTLNQFAENQDSASSSYQATRILAKTPSASERDMAIFYSEYTKV